MKRSKFLKLLLILLFIANAALGSYLIYGIFNLKDTEQNPIANITDNKPIINKKPLIKDSKWETTDFMGAYTFEYPSGWHVGNIWPQDYSQPITVAINKEPINTAPRGGPLAEIVFTDKSGLQEPDSYFQERIDHYNNEYFISNEMETLNAPFGTIYHWTGEIELYEDITTNEAYLFMFEGRIKDNVNKHIIEATGNPFSDKYSEELEHIMLSFEEI